MAEFIEEKIINAVKKLLSENVNDIIQDLKFYVPLIEFGNYGNPPVIHLTDCETTEKERIIRLDAYSMTITFNFPESDESELYCYAYSDALTAVFNENPALYGIVDRAYVTGKKYKPPIKTNCGQGWELVFCLRITVEQMRN